MRKFVGTPDGAQAQRGEERFDEFKAVARMHQHAVALAHAMGGQRRQRALAIQPAPAERRLAADQRVPLRMPARRLHQEMGQVHHPARYRRDAASGICAAGPLIWRAPGC